ncbi:uncharacterized protein Tco025E_01707 [Trypanosoma conorhini]|uniref:Uncharacterized protein n=1 Tax=Trypanosoma conorhini TaxID=83891 RepID=A0A422Q7X9_9TRYP|nr:uncharacterized protein Tco025E_01707 [Trypanosoma conorhini]RNF26078.1 hypothetical protein Tco025E_01707 [Trypanosoma conorhini]
MKYLLLLGRLPGEGLWATAESYSGLVAEVTEAFGDDYNPIFKYQLPCNPKTIGLPNGTCHIIIDDEDDFQIWKNGCVPVAHHRDPLDDIYHPPTPLTTKLYLFRKDVNAFSASAVRGSGGTSRQVAVGSHLERPSPEVLHAEHDAVKVPLYSLLSPLLLVKLGVRVALRHSNAAEAILLSRRSVAGAGEGHWGWMVRKAQSAWGVLRPSFRYLDLDHGVTAINIFNVRDYTFWSRSVGRERVELVVLEHVYRDAAHASCPSSLLAAGGAPRTIAAPREDGGRKDGRGYTVAVEATVRGVHCGLYGPPFTTDARIPLKPSASGAEAEAESSLEHHQNLVAALVRSGIF